jgi:Rps23 Pro-64 3,4-dihydroxylase Tpa1-like proline 4-hydroxylase
MQIHHKVFPEDLLKECSSELDKLMKERCWGSSTLRWHPNLKKGIIGDSIHTYVSEETKNKIIKSVSKYFPAGSKYHMQYYVWLQNAGISSHNDGQHGYGATIYLNHIWDKNHGGIFIWDDGDPLIMKAIVPKRNMMVINDSHEEHMVTPVSALTEYPRCSIQIWVDT